MTRQTLTTTEAAKRRVRYLSAAEVAHQCDRPVGTVYRWAHEDGWRRTSDNRRPVFYAVEDVLTTLLRVMADTPIT